MPVCCSETKINLIWKIGRWALLISGPYFCVVSFSSTWPLSTQGQLISMTNAYFCSLSTIQFWRRFCWPSRQCCLHKPFHSIMPAHSHCHVTICRLGLWKPWRHFWNKFQVLQHLEKQDLRTALCHARNECPTPRQYVPHTFGRFTAHSAHDIWSSFPSLPLVV